MSFSVRTDAATFREAAADAPAGARVPVELRTTVADPFDAYRRARDGPGGVFLETTGGQSGWGYFGVDPVERVQVSSDAVVADTGERTGDYRRDAPTLAALDGVLAGEDLVRGDCDVPYPCGALGWLSYDVARELEDLPGSSEGDHSEVSGAVDDRGLPRLQLAVFDRLVAWECPTEGEVTLRVTCCPEIPAGADDRTSDALADCYDEAVARAESLIERIRAGEPTTGEAPAAGTSATFESDCGREAYADRVRRVQEYVRAGDTFQANVSQRLTAPAAVHPVAAYDALRAVNPAPYSGLVEFGWDGRGVDLVSASPELLLEREPGEGDEVADGHRLVTEPIAGTRPRGETAAEDRALAAELTGDEKERAEHAMLVDLERNDLGKVCEFGTVEVPEYRRVDRYSEVMHLVSLVEGTGRPDVSVADAVGAVFPGGTITGAPKPRTMEIIDELEATRRGPYTGSMAIFGFDGRATLNIVIRTLVRHAQEYHLRVGAGIVHDSDPDAEYEETLAKGRALVTAIDDALAESDLRVEGRSDE
ncbi:anthranilate synthase component I family protein [Haloparvum sp. PAK95]|uniref:anthranilate synthase component I family protein n=1 Tax=Haloparvum sp. PAK95 TaxID=3418962 RepID=UPI003D2F00B8